MKTLNYKQLVDEVIRDGDVVGSRIGPTREVIGKQVCFEAGTMVHRPGFGKALGWMEIMQLLGGVFDVKRLVHVAPKAREEYFTPVSAYGPRAYNAMMQVHDPLMMDVPLERLLITPSSYDVTYLPRLLSALDTTQDSRQVVLFIGKSWDKPEELSCTLTYQFLARRGKLHGIVGMRSWDLIRGLPYDIMMFGGLLQAAAFFLDLEPGHVTVQAGSCHLYESDLALVPEVNRIAHFDVIPKGPSKLQQMDIFEGQEKSWPKFKKLCIRMVYEQWMPLGLPFFIECQPWEVLGDAD